MLKSKAVDDSWYQTREFASLAGVTVRTLHHYDRIGLLKARKRSLTGYRLYQLSDLERLEQIVALRFLSLPLSRIRVVLERDQQTLRQVLASQRSGLLEKRRLLDKAIEAIAAAESALERGGRPTEMLKKIIEVIEMQNDSDWMMKYYSPAAQAKIAERAKAFTPEMQEQVSQAWKDYYRDLAAAGGVPTDELRKRHGDLLAGFTGNDPEVEAGLTALYKDQSNWPEEMKERMKDYGVDPD